MPGKAGRCHESQRFNDRAATSRALVVRVCGSGPRDGVEGAESVDEGGTGVHGHGDAEGFGDFLFCSAGFEGAVGMEGDTAVATRGDGYHNGDELTGFFRREGSFWSWRRTEFGEIRNGFGEFGLISVPIEEHA